METYPTSDPYGRLEVSGMRSTLSERTQRKMTRGKNEFIHRVPNGIHDPFTHFHIVDALLRVRPDELWKSRDLAKFMAENYKQMSWDTVTVGRILNDIAESIEQARPRDIQPALRVAPRWDGNYFVTAPTL